MGGSGGSGGTTGPPGLNAGGGGGEGGDNAVGGAGGDAGSSGGGTGNEGAAGSALTKTGQGGGSFPGGGGFSGVGAGGGGGGGQYGVKELTTLFLGSGGGGGGGHDNGPLSGGNGGDGGGIIFIMANSVTVSGSITSIGAAGVAAASREGAGGGGSGGSILIQANTATLGTSNVQATGGAGGARSATPGAGGGGGGIGRIRVEAAITGTTNPTASTSGTPGASGATFTLAQDVALTGLTKHTIKRLRIEVSNEGELASGSVLYRLEVSQANPASCDNAGNTWTRVDSSSAWNMTASSYFSDGSFTSNIDPGLFDENTTFFNGKLKDSNDQTSGITLSTTEFTEIEYALAATNSATSGATYCFRLTDAGTAGGFNYSETKYGKATLGADLLFGFRKPITIDRSKLSDPSCAVTLTNFPILYSVTDLDLRSTANGGNVTYSTGDDIIFRAYDSTTCGGTAWCGLDHEIEKYDETTGELIAWVRIPSLNTNAAASDTVIYIYYGNSDVATSTQNASAVWDSNYMGVWHLDESPANGVAGHDDSTGNPNDGTPQAFDGAAGSTTDAAGQISGADEFDGIDDYIVAPNSAGLTLTGDVSISAWGFRDAASIDTLVDYSRNLEAEADNHLYQFYAGATHLLGLEWEYGGGLTLLQPHRLQYPVLQEDGFIMLRREMILRRKSSSMSMEFNSERPKPIPIAPPEEPSQPCRSGLRYSIQNRGLVS